MLGFHPRTVVEDIAEACRKQVYSIVSSVDNWANMTHGRPVGSELTEDEVSDLVSSTPNRCFEFVLN
jgi:hypothetical protein